MGIITASSGPHTSDRNNICTAGDAPADTRPKEKTRRDEVKAREREAAPRLQRRPRAHAPSVRKMSAACAGGADASRAEMNAATSSRMPSTPWLLVYAPELPPGSMRVYAAARAMASAGKMLRARASAASAGQSTSASTAR